MYIRYTLSIKTNKISSVFLLHSLRDPVSVLLSVVVIKSDDSEDMCTDFQDEPIQLTFMPKWVSMQALCQDRAPGKGN